VPSKETSDDFRVIPDELLLLIMRFLDLKAFTQFSQTCTRLYLLAQDKSLCLNLCKTDPTANDLIKAAGIEEKLKSGAINPYLFLRGFVKSDFLALSALIGTVKLWIPSYVLSTPKFFKCPVDLPRSLYLTQTVAEKETPNANRVKSWLLVEVSITGSGLEELISRRKLPYIEAIPEANIVRPQGLPVP
jgi:hypothetical protein